MNLTYMDRLIIRGKDQYGDKFDASELDQRFARYWYSKERIKVRLESFLVSNERISVEVKYLKDGDNIYSGTVGMTTGWKPAFLLMLTSRSTGSSHVLNSSYSIIGVKQKGYKKYSNPY